MKVNVNKKVWQINSKSINKTTIVAVEDKTHLFYSSNVTLLFLFSF